MDSRKIPKNEFPEWPASAAEAVLIQNRLRHLVSLRDSVKNPKIIAGVDCSYDVKNNLSYGFIVLMRIGELKIFEEVRAELPTHFPYIPGFLSFREVPVILKALEKLKTRPDILMVDGQGFAHPRRVGVASHLGVLAGIPSIGVAKSRLCGRFEEPGETKGAYSQLSDKGEMIGYVLRSKERTKPLFVSAGHGISHASALKITLNCLQKHRLPEPTRIADKLSKEKGDKTILI